MNIFKYIYIYIVAFDIEMKGWNTKILIILNVELTIDF
jgi:hypothetical protein